MTSRAARMWIGTAALKVSLTPHPATPAEEFIGQVPRATDYGGGHGAPGRGEPVRATTVDGHGLVTQRAKTLPLARLVHKEIAHMSAGNRLGEHVADDPAPVDAGSEATQVRNGMVDEQVTAENVSWVRRLTADGAEFDEAVAALYRLSVKIAYSEAKREGTRLHLAGAELDDVAHQAAADATLAICRKVETFRGECRFTTWAHRFVAFSVYSKVSRHIWQRPTISIDDIEWRLLASDLGEAPETHAENSDLVKAIERAFREDLSERQQRAFEAVVVRGVPIREVAEELRSNPNAIYKTLFDARRKLRRSLASAGYLTDNCA